MKKELYILIFPDDDSGNDNGILDRKEMTEEEALIFNEQFLQNKNGRRWVKLVSKPTIITHL
jgi:hypothetical protein